MAEKQPGNQPPPDKKPSPRFNRRKIAFQLKRDLADIKPFRNPESGIPGFVLETKDNEPESPSSLLTWTEASERRLVRARIDLPGEVKMTAENKRITFTAQDGSVLTHHADGSITFYPHDAAEMQRIRQLKDANEGLPWWQKEKELVENTIIEIAGVVATTPDFGTSTNRNLPYGHFEIGVEGTEKRFDVYAYPDDDALGLLRRRKLSEGQDIWLRASVQCDRQYVAKDETIERRWLRLFNVRRLET